MLLSQTNNLATTFPFFFFFFCGGAETTKNIISVLIVHSYLTQLGHNSSLIIETLLLPGLRHDPKHFSTAGIR